MKKIIGSFIFLACLLGLSSCGMKECKCYSTNLITQNDSVVQNKIDTVSNFTRNTCEEFNNDSTYVMDEANHIIVQHSIRCEEE